jgi:hypothetical protein
MPVAVIALSMLAMLALTAPSGASQSCMNRTEARQHFGSVPIYWHGQDHCWDAIPTGRHQTGKVQSTIDQPRRDKSTSEVSPVDEPVSTAWADCWANIERSQSGIDARWADIAQVAPPLVAKSGATDMPRGVVLVVIAIVLTLGTIEVMFRCAIQ